MEHPPAAGSQRCPLEQAEQRGLVSSWPCLYRKRAWGPRARREDGGEHLPAPATPAHVASGATGPLVVSVSRQKDDKVPS